MAGVARGVSALTAGIAGGSVVLSRLHIVVMRGIRG
jgi:hypothetical protein